MSRRLFFLIAGMLMFVSIGIVIFVGIKNQDFSKQYQSSMDRISTIEEQLVQIHSTIDQNP